MVQCVVCFGEQGLCQVEKSVFCSCWVQCMSVRSAWLIVLTSIFTNPSVSLLIYIFYSFSQLLQIDCVFISFSFQYFYHASCILKLSYQVHRYLKLLCLLVMNLSFCHEMFLLVFCNILYPDEFFFCLVLCQFSYAFCLIVYVSLSFAFNQCVFYVLTFCRQYVVSVQLNTGCLLIAVSPFIFNVIIAVIGFKSVCFPFVVSCLILD